VAAASGGRRWFWLAVLPAPETRTVSVHPSAVRDHSPSCRIGRIHDPTGHTARYRPRSVPALHRKYRLYSPRTQAFFWFIFDSHVRVGLRG